MNERPLIEPDDEFNRRLVEAVHPPHWVNPTPAARYNMVVIGAGTAGLVTAAAAAGLGAKVALIERHLMGGDCLNVGCVPSKAILAAARAAAAVRDAGEFGVHTGPSRVDFTHVMRRMRRLRAEIAPHDSAHRFASLGVDVFIGDGRFTGPDTVEVDGKTLRFAKACIATGARAAAPPIPGLSDVAYLTNETVFSLTELPRRLAVIGAGPIGCELAQAFARFGSEVTLIEAMHGILPNEDPDAAEIVRHAMLERDGARLLCCGKQTTIRPGPDGTKRITLDSHDHHYDVTVDAILVAVGRAPNIEWLNLDAAGVTFDKQGVAVDDHLRTTNPRIYAAGDVCSKYKFTHAADFMARIVIRNALFPFVPFRARFSKLTIPWCTYTDPELAHVGLTIAEAIDRGLDIDTHIIEMAHVDRAILDGQTTGLLKVHTSKGKDRILGTTIVAPHAGEMISQITAAIVRGIGLKGLANVIHPYPTQAEAIRKAGDAFNRSRLSPRVKAVLAKWMAWQR